MACPGWGRALRAALPEPGSPPCRVTIPHAEASAAAGRFGSVPRLQVALLRHKPTGRRCAALATSVVVGSGRYAEPPLHTLVDPDPRQGADRAIGRAIGAAPQAPARGCRRRLPAPRGVPGFRGSALCSRAMPHHLSAALAVAFPPLAAWQRVMFDPQTHEGEGK